MRVVSECVQDQLALMESVRKRMQMTGLQQGLLDVAPAAPVYNFMCYTRVSGSPSRGLSSAWIGQRQFSTLLRYMCVCVGAPLLLLGCVQYSCVSKCGHV